MILSSIPVGEHSCLDPVSFLTNLGDVSQIEEQFLSWPQQPEQLLYFPSLDNGVVDDFAAGVLTRLVTDMVAHSAFPLCDLERGYAPRPEHTVAANTLVAAGFVEKIAVGDGLLRFSQAGMRHMRQAWLLDAPTRVCGVREGIPLEDATVYELICHLRRAGWAWQRWTGAKTLPRGYFLGAPKVWFTSGASPPRQYLEALLRAEELSVEFWAS